MKLGAISHSQWERGACIIGQRLLLYMAVYKYKDRNKSLILIDRLA